MHSTHRKKFIIFFSSSYSSRHLNDIFISCHAAPVLCYTHISFIMHSFACLNVCVRFVHYSCNAALVMMCILERYAWQRNALQANDYFIQLCLFGCFWVSPHLLHFIFIVVSCICCAYTWWILNNNFCFFALCENKSRTFSYWKAIVGTMCKNRSSEIVSVCQSHCTEHFFRLPNCLHSSTAKNRCVKFHMKIKNTEKFPSKVCSKFPFLFLASTKGRNFQRPSQWAKETKNNTNTIFNHFCFRYTHIPSMYFVDFLFLHFILLPLFLHNIFYLYQWPCICVNTINTMRSQTRIVSVYIVSVNRTHSNGKVVASHFKRTVFLA